MRITREQLQVWRDRAAPAMSRLILLMIALGAASWFVKLNVDILGDVRHERHSALRGECQRDELRALRRVAATVRVARDAWNRTGECAGATACNDARMAMFDRRVSAQLREWQARTSARGSWSKAEPPSRKALFHALAHDRTSEWYSLAECRCMRDAPVCLAQRLFTAPGSELFEWQLPRTGECDVLVDACDALADDCSRMWGALARMRLVDALAAYTPQCVLPFNERVATTYVHVPAENTPV